MCTARTLLLRQIVLTRSASPRSYPLLRTLSESRAGRDDCEAFANSATCARFCSQEVASFAAAVEMEAPPEIEWELPADVKTRSFNAKFVDAAAMLGVGAGRRRQPS